ncbi:response regulator transcription factor [Luteolibacter ambystomatis]|uniref:Response regulator transcription factor n=2 Tax=Luteolibacter ambystomatis TaxID=2824561 RepID=A0A975J3C5_9BACT|nr:response regulator transcription factor [Luteolibacter ambystomatis]
MAAMRVLVVEDQTKIARALETALAADGAEVVIAGDGDRGLQLALESRFDVVVLDIMLPGLDGLEVLRELRARHHTTPVLLLSARGEVDDRIRGLDLGADDYLPKPFVLAEVTARVRVLARRAAPADAPRLVIADLSIDFLRHEVKRGGHRIDLTTRELRLLTYLARANGRACPRDELHQQVWDYAPGYDPGTNVVQVAMVRLREKLDAPFKRKLIHTVFAEGYAVRDTP